MNFYFTVASSSMSPALKIGSKITVETVKSENIRTGQVIVFKSISERLIVHRVIKKNGFIVVTAGDSNRKFDGPVHIFDVVGTVQGIVEKKPQSAFLRTLRAIKRKMCNIL